jgi:hypothetical protein
MSSAEKAYGLIKSVMLMNERFDGLDDRIKTVSSDLAALARNHADLSERVSRIEGFIDGATAASGARTRKLPKK